MVRLVRIYGGKNGVKVKHSVKHSLYPVRGSETKNTSASQDDDQVTIKLRNSDKNNQDSANLVNIVEKERNDDGETSIIEWDDDLGRPIYRTQSPAEPTVTDEALQDKCSSEKKHAETPEEERVEN